VTEAGYFASRLAAEQVTVAAAVANRVQPRFGPITSAAALTHAAGGGPDAAAWTNLAELHAVAEAEEEEITRLARLTGCPDVATVPLLDDDVHDLAGLAAVRRHLFA
jgi:hypothetical protein